VRTTRLFAGALLLPLLAFACAEPSPPPVRPAPTAPQVDPPAPDAGPPTPTVDTEAAPSPIDASASQPAEPTEPPEIRPGVGSCKVDDDCELGHSIDPAKNGKSACCFRFCPPMGVVSKAVLEREAAWREKSCGPMTCGKLPPKPCRPNADEVIPRCVEGKCASEVHHRAPPPDPMY
jgi:hypothetical protein